MTIETIECHTVEELFNTLRLTRTDLWGESLFPEWIFRGHADQNWKLMPRIWRENEIDSITNGNKEILAIFETDRLHGLKRELHSMGYTISNLDKLLVSNFIERSLVGFFTILAEDIGLINNQIWRRGRKNRIEFYLDTQKYCHPGEYLDTLTLAQHSGIPTRLLDWSRDPMKALSFAALTECDAQYSKIICLNISKMDNIKDISNENIPYLVEGNRRENTNLHNQDGLFTYIPSCINYYQKNNRFSHEDIYKEHNKLLEIKFSRENVKQIRRNLITNRLSPAHLMPNFYECANVSEQMMKLRISEMINKL